MAQVDFLSRRNIKPIGDTLQREDEYRSCNKRQPLRLRLYCNGDRFFKGKKVCLDPRSYHSFTELMNHLMSRMPADIYLPNGVRQIFTPTNGRRVVNMEGLRDGDYVLAGNESFKPIKYGCRALEPWGKSQGQGSTSYNYRFGGRYGPHLAVADDSHYAGYNAFPPSRFHRPLRSNRYPYIQQGTHANRYKILRGEPESTARSTEIPGGGAQSLTKPRVITVVQSGNCSPRKVIKVLLNRRSVQPFEQLVGDISGQFGSQQAAAPFINNSGAAVDGVPNIRTKLFTVKGREVQGINDFFREDDMFIWVPPDTVANNPLGLGLHEVVEILRDLFPDRESHVRTLLKDWERRWRRAERNRRKQHEQQHQGQPHQRQTKRTSLGYGQKYDVQQPSNSLVSIHQASSEDDKRDSGFDESEPAIHSHVYDDNEEPPRSTYRGLQTDLPPLKVEQDTPRLKGRVIDDERRRHGLPLLRQGGTSKDLHQKMQRDKIERRAWRRQQAVELERKHQRPIRQTEEIAAEQQAAESTIRQRRLEAKEAREKEEREKEAREREAREREIHEKEVREKEARERAALERELREKEAREKVAREKEARIREKRERKLEEERAAALQAEVETERKRRLAEEEAVERKRRQKMAAASSPASPPVRPTPDKAADAGDSLRLPVVEEEKTESRRESTTDERQKNAEAETEAQRLRAQKEDFAAAEAAARRRAMEAEKKRQEEESATTEAMEAAEEQTRPNKDTEESPDSSRPKADDNADEANKENQQSETAPVQVAPTAPSPAKAAPEDKKASRGRPAAQRSKASHGGKIMRQCSCAEHVYDKYEIGKVMGDGNFAIVRACRKRDSGNEYAMKIIDKSKLRGRENMVENEIEIMRACNHANIVKLREEYETPTEIFLVMELVKGGDLFDAITQSVKFNEPQSASMVNDLTQALFYLHSRMIVHRDLKPENLLVVRNKSGACSLKLADFGLAMEVKRLIYTVCGTPTYVAPEILEEKGYGLEVDLWALGVITYILLCGFPPFRSPERKQTELFEMIKSGRFEFLSPYWDNISSSAKDLISHLLVVDRKRRYSAIDVLCHPWVISVAGTKKPNKPMNECRQKIRSELESNARANLENFRSSRTVNNNNSQTFT